MKMEVSGEEGPVLFALFTCSVGEHLHSHCLTEGFVERNLEETLLFSVLCLAVLTGVAQA